MNKKTFLTIAVLGLAGFGATLSLVGSQGGPGIPADVLNILKKHCVRCHTGPKPPKGLSFIPGKVASAIDAPSAEIPDLKLIDTQAPETSYLLKKVRGDSGITGKSMPPGKPLTAEEIQVLEKWIAGLK